jgi:hypothetical protein
VTPSRVLYILGWGRSGSTVLANILGEVEGFFSTGELHYLWERSLLQNRRCGCGDAIVDCVVWSRVLDRIGVPGTIDPATVVGWIERSMRIRRTPALLRSRPGSSLQPPSLASYGALLEDLYAAIGSVTGARVLVDSSKIPADAALLRLLPRVDATYVQLVRDPRAVAYSWARVKEQHDPNAPNVMIRHGAVDSTVNWTTWNLAAERLARLVGPQRFHRVRYEDLMRDPRATVGRIVGFAGEPADRLPFDDDRTARLGPNHTVSGNPDRFRSGAITLRADDQWVRSQGTSDRWISTVLASPLLARYGYPVRARTASA